MFLPLIGLIPLLPLLGFLISGLFGKRLPKHLVTAVACGSMLLAFFVAAGAVLQLRTLPPGEWVRAQEATGVLTAPARAASYEVNYWTWIPSLPFVTGTEAKGDAGGEGQTHASSATHSMGAPAEGSTEENEAASAVRSGQGTGTTQAEPDSAGRRAPAGPPAIERTGLEVAFGFRLDALSAIMILIVTGVGFLIHVYSVGYMAHDPGYARYFAYLNLFSAMMLTLVLANNFLVMFVGWEGVGLCSYLLIGFWYEDPEKAQAGRKAFITNRLGDFAFMLAMLAILYLFHTLDFAKVMSAIAAGGGGTATLTLIALALFAGACGKSAQIPLFVWLPDAMAGPTPVSALIHAATMVTAGVYMVARCSVLFVHAPAALTVVAIVGAATALFAATIGLAQTDIKKVLAYSTVSQLGYMFLGLGVGAFSGAIFHLMTHAFFKALLFLGAGSVIHAMSNEQDMRRMGGLKRKLPWTYGTMLTGALAIAGIPIFSGFFSKDEILWRVWEGGHPILWAVGAAAAGLTAFYMFRLMYMTFHGAFRGSHDQEHHLHESPPSMVVPLVVLAALSIAGGWVGIPHALGRFAGIPNYFESYLAPVLADLRHDTNGADASSIGAPDRPSSAPLHDAASGNDLPRAESAIAAPHENASASVSPHGVAGAPADSSVEYAFMGLAVAIALGGIFTAWRFYREPNDLPARAARAAGPLYGLVLNKYWVDELYDATVLRAYYALSAFFDNVDRWVVDGAVNSIAAFTEMIGQILRLFQTGYARNYALYIFLGAVIMVWMLGR